ncbi:glycosyltransferase [Pseudalkalibacillus caeni]|uniref:glycosyltransferase n=1 Tax=Exobacillus caeni TaxID=2574798 RepID=UPI001FE970F1|nr:glycosyltransferase [Pseudalkalibacillus caeni]
MSVLKVVLATPYYHQARGNTVTVQRISEGLNHLGIDTEVISVTDYHKAAIPQADLVHGFNAYHFYKFMETLESEIKNYVITFTGTDLNHDLDNSERRNDVIASLLGAKAVHVFDGKAKQKLLSALPQIEEKLFVISQGASDFQTAHPFPKEKDTFVFLLPAGIRKVKNVTSAIKMLKPLHKKHPEIRLWLVGPVIEEEEGIKVNNLVKQNEDWIKYFGEVSHRSMGAIYQSSDTILNTSHSEGQSSAILEAMGSSLPVIVSGNQGNRNIVFHEKTGFIYENEIEFTRYAELLLTDPSLREKIGLAGKRYVASHHSDTKEAEAVLAMYEHALNTSSH